MSDGELPIEAWEDGSAFMVKAHAGARRDALAGLHAGMLKVEVTTAPEKGKANRAIGKFLSKQLDLPGGALTLLSGDVNPVKRFGVRGVKPGELRRRLAAAMQ